MKDRELQPSRWKKAAAFGAVVLIFLLGGILLQLFSYKLPLFGGNIYLDEPDWFFGEKGGRLQPTELSDRHTFQPGKTYVLTTELSYNGDGDPYPSAFITSGNFEIRAFLDGEETFHYTRADRGFSHVQGIGGAAFTISLGQNCGGRALSFELATPMHETVERRLPGISMGDYAALMQDLQVSYLPGILISAAILFVVLVLVLMGNLEDGTQWTYLYFSIFSYFIVLYRAMQDLYFMYIWANPYMSFLCEFFSLAACPIPLMLSYRSELKPLMKRTFNAVMVFLWINLGTQVVLHFTGLVDVSQLLEVTHLVLLGCAVVLVCAAMVTRRKQLSMKPFKKLLPILAGALLDFLVYSWRMHFHGAGSFFPVGNYIGLGLLVSLIMMVLDARREREKAYREEKRNQYLEKIAYMDALTGLYNRAAFTRELAEIQAGTHKDQRILVVAADLNGLKRINDSLGHQQGDLLLQRAARVLEDSFSNYGRVFRTGGDEFFAVLYDVDLFGWQDLKMDYDRLLEHRNLTEKIPLSVALGHAFLEGEDLDGCIKKADRRMYDNKSTSPERRKPGPGAE